MSQHTNWFQDLTTEEAKNDRAHLIFWLCRAVLLTILLGVAVVWATKAYATEIPVHVVEHDGVKMKLLNSPCVDKVSKDLIATAPEKYQPRFRAISSQWRAKDGTWGDFAGCWAEIKKEEVNAPDDIFVLVFSDGAVVQVFRSELLKKPGQTGV